MANKKTKSPEHICCHCGKKYDSLSYFYKSYSPLYKGTGYFPICKTCFNDAFEMYAEKYNSDRKAMQRLCMAFDLYYSAPLFNKCNNGTDSTIGNYVKALNMVQYKNRSFETSLDEGFSFTNEPILPGLDDVAPMAATEKPENTEPVADYIKPKDVEKWGEGFQPAEYNALNAHYKLLKTANPNCDTNQEIFIVELCYIKMQQMKAVHERRVDDFNKLTDSYRKSFQQAGLKTAPDDTQNSDDCWSEWVGIIGQFTPEEYYRDKTLYADWDKLGEYYERMAIRPLRNLQLGTKDRDAEYSVQDNDGGSSG